MTIPHVSEKYRCDQCEKLFQRNELDNTWKCPHCSEPISIKIQVGNSSQSCHRLTPPELKIGHTVTLDFVNTHRILKVTSDGATYKIALKEHGILTKNKKEYLTVINGAWTD